MPGRTLKETRSGLAAMVAGQPDCFTTACDPERRASGQLVSQSLSQVEHGLGVDLAGAAPVTPRISPISARFRPS